MVENVSKFRQMTLQSDNMPTQLFLLLAQQIKYTRFQWITIIHDGPVDRLKNLEIEFEEVM
jgi:hypothetical protein